MENEEIVMTEAYDIKVLQARLKKKGLEIGERALADLVKEIFKFLRESAPLSATPYDDMASIVYPQVEAMLLKAIDKIDGKENN